MKKYLLPLIITFSLMIGLIASGAADRILVGIGVIEHNQITTPTNPPASSNRLYIKSDDDLYLLNSAGTEDNVSITDLANEVSGLVGSANGGLGIDSSALTGFPSVSSGTWSVAANIDLTTDVTGTLPIANGGTNGATATVGFDNLSPITTKGDLIAGDVTVNAIRLAVGTNGQVLTADSAEASGIKWATSAGGGGGGLTTTPTKTTAYTAVSGDLVQCDASGGAFTVTLPPVSANTLIGIKNLSTGVCTIDGDAAETIDGSADLALVSSGDFLILQGNNGGTEWLIIDEKISSYVNATFTAGDWDNLATSAGGFVEIINASQTLGSGAQTTSDTVIRIPCSTTNAPTGATCSTGSESAGLSFVSQKANENWRVCAHFNYRFDIADCNNKFKIVLTPDSAQTITEDGVEIASTLQNTNTDTLGWDMDVCGDFSVSVIKGRNTFRLFTSTINACGGSVNRIKDLYMRAWRIKK